MSAERVKIYIDGGNTYKALFKESKNSKDNSLIPRTVPSGKIFSFKEFALFLSSNRNLCGKAYYVGFIIERGKIVYDHEIREKGVDVKIAIDIVIDGIEDKYDTAIIVSSDTDLIPAIKYVQSKGKKVEYIGFSNHTSVGLIKECDNQRVFVSADLKQFII